MMDSGTTTRSTQAEARKNGCYPCSGLDRAAIHETRIACEQDAVDCHAIVAYYLMFRGSPRRHTRDVLLSYHHDYQSYCDVVLVGWMA